MVRMIYWRICIASPSKIPPYDGIINRIVFTGAGYSLVSLMDAAFAEVLCKYKDKPNLCAVLSDTCFRASHSDDEFDEKAYDVGYYADSDEKKEAIKLYGEILDRYIYELEKDLGNMEGRQLNP